MKESNRGAGGVNKAGFSLLEIILVIALIALVGGLIVVDTGSLVRTFSAPPLDRQIQQALLEARDTARLRNEAVVVAFADNPPRLYLASSAGSPDKEWPLGSSPSQRIRLSFLTPQPATRPEADRRLEIMASRPHMLIDAEGYPPPTIIEWSERSRTNRAAVDIFTMELIQ